MLAVQYSSCEGVSVWFMHEYGRSEAVLFLCILICPHRNSVNVSTKRLQYNITDLLQDTTYNHYIARVLAISGDANKSEFAESQIFSFNFCKSTARIICKSFLSSPS